MHRLRALVTKNFIRMLRDITFLLFQFVLPTIQVSIFCIAIGHDLKGLSIAVVNEEIGGKECQSYSPQCLFKVYQMPTNRRFKQRHNLSCHFLEHIDSDLINLVHYEDYQLARRAVTNGDHWGVIHFLPDFTEGFIYRKTAIFYTGFPDLEVMKKSYIYIDLDTTNQEVTSLLKRSFYKSFHKFTDDIFHSCYSIGQVSGFPAYLEQPIYGSLEPDFTEFMAPGTILTIAFFMAVGLTAQSFILDRNNGLLERISVAGVTSTENMLAYIISQLLVVLIQVTFVLIFVLYVFQIPSKGSLWLLGLLTTLQGICGMCLGLVISAICKSEENAIQVALGLFYPTLLLSGILWPLEGMPENLKNLSYLLPQTMACKAMRGILSRGWDFTWKIVYLGFLSTIAWIVAFLVLGSILLRKRKS